MISETNLLKNIVNIVKNLYQLNILHGILRQKVKRKVF